MTSLAGILIGLGAANLYWSAVQWTLSDAGAYWNAGMRLRDGGELYAAVANVEASDVFRYAPWFAWAAIPWTYLPQQVAGALWSSLLIAASVAAVIPLARRRAWLQVVFFFPILIGISAVGNVQALMVTALVWGVERRSGPLWIALAASLKAVPILLALVYLGRREWWRAAASLALTVVLVAPAFLYDLSGYVTSTGSAGLLVELPLLYAIVALVACTAAVWRARRPDGWLAGATAVVLATPRFFVYDVTYLLVGAPRTAESDPAPGPPPRSQTHTPGTEAAPASSLSRP